MTCAYCLENRELADEQILMRGENTYLCAPRGQLVEGYLAIAPYECIGALSRMPMSYLDEVIRLTAVVVDFYAAEYGVSRYTIYEQGRGGGGAVVDEDGGFPLHAHLCCLPLAVDLHALLACEYLQKGVSDPREIPAVAGSEPYIYVESRDGRFVYIASSGEQRRELERKRLKPAIAALAGFPERGYWRTYPGDRELNQLIERWRKRWPT